MKASIKLLFLGMFLGLVAASHVSGQNYRTPPDSLVQRLKADTDLNYAIDLSQPEPSAWERFWLFLNQLYQSLFLGGGSGSWLRYLLYLLAALLIGFALYKLTQMERQGLFKKEANQRPDYGLRQEDLNEIDFEAEIAQAYAQKNYRLVVRLNYLKVLHVLNQNKQIEVKAGKTNHHYSYEIENAAVLHSFNKLSRWFDYAWYGGFDVEEATALSCQKEAEKLQALF